jgi:hypothetical protein
MTTDIEKADSRKQQLPSDYSGHAEEFKLLASYSGVAPDEIERHVREVVSTLIRVIVKVASVSLSIR